MAEYQRKKELPESVQKGLRQLAKRLKELRIQNGHGNYERFAYDNDISRGQYWKYEKGESDLRFSVIIRLAEAHGLSLAEFFAEGFDDSEKGSQRA